jgi:hypothetical protein
MSMANANEALRRGDNILKRVVNLEADTERALNRFELLEDLTIPRIEALEKQLERAIRRINALEALASTASAEVDELAVTLGEPAA